MIAPFYVVLYAKLDRVAMRHGYALAAHGSVSRDFDIVAVPWTDDADDPEQLIDALDKFINHGASKKRGKPVHVDKPHGRKAYVIFVGYDGYYLDISVMPRLQKDVETTTE